MKRIGRIINTYKFLRRAGSSRLAATLSSLYLDGGAFFRFIEWWKTTKQERTP